MRRSLASLIAILSLANCGNPTTPSSVAQAIRHPPPVRGATVANNCNPAANLSTHGGGSVQASRLVVVNVQWGSGVRAQTVSDANALVEALANTWPTTPYLSWLGREYGAPPVGYYGAISITPQTTSSTTLTDGQIQTELAKQVSLGTLTPGTGYLYMLFFPPGFSISSSSLGNSCQAFCSYHYVMTVNGQPLYYAVMPDFNTAGCNTVCEGGGVVTIDEGQQMVESHEIAEVLTDPDASTGWLDTNQPALCSDEIGDICNQLPAKLSDSSGHEVTVQRLWSNLAHDCVVGDVSPEVTSVSPSSGLMQGGQQVTITGNRFALGSGTTFYFGPVASSGTNCTSSTACTTTVPPYDATRENRTVRVSAMVNGAQSSWEGVQDNYTYTCQPATCPFNFCGSMSDGCGGSLDCGCPSGDVCDQGACCSPSPWYLACGTATCGTASDGCGGVVSCGPPCPCTPNPDPCAGLSCGQANDGCGGPTISCGTCAFGLSCDGGQCVRLRNCPTGTIDCDGVCVKPNFCS